jgi:hypothetical protein
MNKQLLIAVLATAFSGMNLVADTMPNYDHLPFDSQQHCTANNTENCQKHAALYVLAQELTHNGATLSLEQAEELDNAFKAIVLEMAQKEIIIAKDTLTKETNTAVTLFEQAEAKDNDVAQEVAAALEALNPQE